MNRQDYLREYGEQCRTNGSNAANAVHRKYYAQFVDDRTISHVVRIIGGDNIKASTDPHFNDIGLHRWDMAAAAMPKAIRFADVSDYPSDSGCVCIAKEAARQYVEQCES